MGVQEAHGIDSLGACIVARIAFMMLYVVACNFSPQGWSWPSFVARRTDGGLPS